VQNIELRFQKLKSDSVARTPFFLMPFWGGGGILCARVCVCVCEREREREDYTALNKVPYFQYITRALSIHQKFKIRKK
jgi:hypothetical protein